MSACFTCHGAESTSVAPSDCALCHPPGFSLKPASHDQAFFSGGHARVAEVQGTDDCFLCHTGGKENFCQACHGLDMPHPGGWALDAGGGPGAHVATAHQDATICVRCHDNSGATPQGCFGGECHGS